MRSLEKAVSAKLVPDFVAEAVKANRPRPGFSAELLSALERAPIVASIDDGRSTWLDRWVVPGLLVGTAGAAGLLCFELGRRTKVRRAARSVGKLRLG